MSSHSVTDNVLALVLAGGEGERMSPLTARRAKPALPFGGTYRLIDFTLSNLVNSEVRDVWVVEQFQPHSLNDHLLNGRPWDLDRNRGGLRLLPPYTVAAGNNGDEAGQPQKEGFHPCCAAALRHHARYIREFAPDLLIVCPADQVYTLDFRLVLEAHRDNHAEITFVTGEVPLNEAGRYGTLETDPSGQVTRWDYKPDTPQSGIVATEIFVYTASVLLEVLEQLAGSGTSGKKRKEPPRALRDFGYELLPAMVERGRAYTFPMPGYWRDVGSLQSYWEGHMDLLQTDSALRLSDAAWPILTASTMPFPARIGCGAQIENSLLSPGCTVEGTVINSILCPGAVVEAGAKIRDTVVLGDAWIKRGARLSHAIVNEGMLVLGTHHGVPGDIAIIARET